MKRRDVLRALSAFTLTILTCSGNFAPAAAGQKAANDKYAHCAKACQDCAAACSACNKHCDSMIAAGQKQHEKSKHLSEDCRDICATAAKLVARHGPMTAAICEACAKACDACGAECQKYPDMKAMKDCAQSCAACAKACREMLKS